MRKRSERGMTLMEVMIAVTLVSVLSVGMMLAMRVGLDAMAKANGRVMHNRRVTGAQRILQAEIGGLMPTSANCRVGGGNQKIPFFQGDERSLRFVSTYSLDGAWRGVPRILEFAVIPGDEGRGVRLIVNESVYWGPDATGALCLGMSVLPELGSVPRYRPVEPQPTSFVLADKLAFCRFLYLAPGLPPDQDRWQTNWLAYLKLPLSVRVEMAPLEENIAGLKPVTVTAPVRVNRSSEIVYGDY